VFQQPLLDAGSSLEFDLSNDPSNDASEKKEEVARRLRNSLTVGDL